MQHTFSISRRKFISSGAKAAIALSIPSPIINSLKKSEISINIIADLHQDIMHDGKERMDAFVTYCRQTNADAVLQMGDFAYPSDKNKQVIEAFNNVHPVHLHVIGNHDTDAGFTKQQCIDYWGMTSAYYAYKLKDIWIIVLDGNEKGSPAYKGGYPSYIGTEQLKWLQNKLEEIDAPALIVSHQPLAGPLAVDNAKEVQQILSSYKHKILLAINGHTHIDDCLNINGVHYVHINSASYFWLGDRYKHQSYDRQIHEKYPWIAYTAPYMNALFTTITIHPKKKKIFIKGMKTEWVGKTPAELNYENKTGLQPGKEIIPAISSRKF